MGVCRPARCSMDECTRVKAPHIDRLRSMRERLEKADPHKIWVDTSGQHADLTYNHVDLFSGCGGNMEGMRDAGFRTLLSVELDDDAAETLRLNFPDTVHIHGDVRRLRNDTLHSVVTDHVHVLSAGFPCQGFSVAGMRRLDDERNQLYMEVARIAKAIRPDYVVLENVPGIVSMADGMFVNAIRKAFRRIGYPNMSVQILESATYGVAQVRPRAIFIANRLGRPNPYPAPILEPDQYRPIESALGDLESVPYGGIPNHEWTWHRPDMIDRLAAVPPGGSLYSTYVDAAKRQYRGLPAMTVKENHGGTHIHYRLDRMISAREMARLQGFEDEFVFYGRMKRVMWQVGNAAPPPLFRHIGLAIRRHL